MLQCVAVCCSVLQCVAVYAWIQEETTTDPVMVGLLIVLSSACLPHILLNGVLMKCKDVCIRKCVAVCATTHTATHCR